VVKKNTIPFTDENLSLFISRFSTGSHAFQGFDKSTGRVTYEPGDKGAHISPDQVKKHMEGEVTLGSYCISPQNECINMCIDFDIETIVAKEAFMKNDKKSKERKEEALAQIRADIKTTMTAAMEKLGIDREQMLIEFSGNKGYHIWLFFEGRKLALDVYKMTRVFATELNLKCEIFPKQASISKNGLGSLIKIPLGIHKKTNERCLFMDDNFNAFADQWSALSATEPISDEQISNILKLRDTESERIEDDDTDDVTKIGGSIERMIEKCDALQCLKSKSENVDEGTGTINLTHIERLCLLSLFKKFGEIGRIKLHQFMANTHNYDHEKCDKPFNTFNAKPMLCKTMRDNGICAKECEAIIDSGGKSPIKLSTDGKSKGGETMILYTLSEIENPLLRNRRIRADFVVTALTDNPYGSTKKCTFEQCEDGGCPKYGECKAENKDNQKIINIAPDQKEHIQVYGLEDSKVNSILKSKVAGCISPKGLQMGNKETYLVQPFACSNIVKMSGAIQETKRDAGDSIVAAKEMKDYMAFFLGNSLESSKAYRGWGIILLNPQTQAWTVLFDKVEPVAGTVDNFEVNESNKDRFELVQGMGLFDKIKDFSDNITFIKGRDELTLSVLLVHFSVLNFDFNNAPLSRGWMELAIIGDTGQAKSTLTTRIIDYIGLGRVEGSNTTLAGLLGGINKLQNSNYVQWGVFPKCNKGLIFVDEVQNMSREIWNNMRTMRSTGVAKVTKIIQRETEARVRLIVAANPKPDDRCLDDFKYGSQALATVMDPADIRRFDLAQFLSRKDIVGDCSNVLNEMPNPRLGQEAIREAVQWAWSRKPEDVVISLEVTKAILALAKELSDKYGHSSDTPLCNASDMREKLARMVVASAAMQLRTPDFIHVVPSMADVAIIKKLIDMSYGNPNVALQFASADRRRETEMDEDQYTEFKAKVNGEEFPGIKKAMEGLMNSDELRSQDIAGWADIDSAAASKIIALLTQHQMVVGKFGAYKAKPKMIRFMKKLMQEGNDDGAF
jgi:hypothetical protein